MMGKWQSRRWWVAIWAMAMSTFIIIMATLEGNIVEGLSSALMILVGIAGGYIAADSLTKKKE